MSVADAVKLALILLAPVLAALGADASGTISPLAKLLCVAFAGSTASALAFMERMNAPRRPPEYPEPES